MIKKLLKKVCRKGYASGLAALEKSPEVCDEAPYILQTLHMNIAQGTRVVSM